MIIKSHRYVATVCCKYPFYNFDAGSGNKHSVVNNLIFFLVIINHLIHFIKLIKYYT